MPPPEQVERARAQISSSRRAESAFAVNVRFVVEPVQR
jgi:hypothetical protein